MLVFILKILLFLHAQNGWVLVVQINVESAGISLSSYLWCWMLWVKYWFFTNIDINVDIGWWIDFVSGVLKFDGFCIFHKKSWYEAVLICARRIAHHPYHFHYIPYHPIHLHSVPYHQYHHLSHLQHINHHQQHHLSHLKHIHHHQYHRLSHLKHIHRHQYHHQSMPSPTTGSKPVLQAVAVLYSWATWA